MTLSDGRISPDYDFNPFATTSSLTTSPVESEFPSRYASTSSTNSSRSSSVFHTSRRSLHSRAQTEVPTTSHPLRGGSSPTSDANVTRPTLTRRMIKTGQLVDVPVSRGTDQEEQMAGPDEKTVLAHEVTANDSLAGVSLKYGISLADLRRANHLWASDSIHLRKVLYIPLDKSSRAHIYIKEKTPPLISVHDPDPQDEVDHIDEPPPPPRHHTVADRPSSKILRVPLSEMSFFPPSSSKVPYKRPVRPVATPLPTGTPRSSFHTRYASSPPSSFNTLLTALPIAASTRDTIIARLSFDSTGTSPSDRASNDEMHPLDDVRRSDEFERTPRPIHKPPKRTPPPPVGDISLDAVKSVRSARVRTSQLEPSADMQFPATTGRGKVRPRLASVNFEAGS